MKRRSVTQWSDERGVNLIEIMIAVAVTLVVVTAGFTVLATTNKSMRANGQVADTQQNVRVAMEMISRDVKLAGYGMVGSAVGACNTAIVPADNNPAGPDAGPDSVSLVVPTTSSVAPLWTLAAAAGPGFNQITLQAGAVGPAATAGTMQSAGLAVNSVISLAGATTATVSAIGGNTLTLNPPVAAPASFPAGTPVYLLQCITYQVIPSPDPNQVCQGNSPCLTRGVAAAALNCNVAGSPCAPITAGIEDLQLAYGCDGCNAAVNGGIADGIIDDQNASNSFDQADFLTNTTWATSPLTPSTIMLVQVNIVARQTSADEGLGEGTPGSMVLSGPVVISDHNPVNDATYDAATYGQFRRRLLIRTVDARNLRL